MDGRVDQLATAILDQARRLADQYQIQAQSNRERILREAREKLHLREQREVLVAKSRADRAYRRTVQSQELRLQARLDRLRWSLVTDALDRVREQLRELVDDEARYLPLLQGYLATGVAEFGDAPLLVTLNARDQQRLRPRWDDFCAGHGSSVSLSEQTLEVLGGMLIETPDRRMRLDQTFEGRMRRLQLPLAEVIQSSLSPAAVIGEDQTTST